MRVCTKCNSVLGDGDLQCPSCAAMERAGGAKPYSEAVPASSGKVYTEKRTDSSDTAIGILNAESRRDFRSETEGAGAVSEKPQKPPVSATQAFTIEIPLGEVLEQLEREKKAEKQLYTEEAPTGNAKGRLDKKAQTADSDESTVEFPFEKMRSAKKAGPEPDKNAGIIEQELAAREQSAGKTAKKSLSKLGVSLFAILIIAVLAFSTAIVMKLVREPEAADEDYYLTRLTGTWSGEPFRFVDDPDDPNKYMELLKINSDATFTIQYLIVNENVPYGYLDGEWEVMEEFSGTVKILPDNATLALMYEQGGENLVFVRDIVEMEDNRIVLREYSDNTDYFYDMAFKRER